MNGLLDFLKTPMGQAVLATGMGAAASAGRGRGLLGNLGQGGLMGLQAYGGAQEREYLNAERKKEGELRDMQLSKARRQDEFMQNLPAPTNPNQQMLADAARAGALPLADYLKATQPKQLEFGKIEPKDYTPESLREAMQTGDYTRLVPVRKMDVVNNQAVNLYNTQPGQVFDTFDPNKPFNLQGGRLAPNQAFQNYELSKAKAGKTDVHVNTGQKGLDNELKIRGDFRSEPIYKAHQDVQAAYQQISQALKQASPAGDMAGATKIMKLLDPGSVVRESELGMAMAATGLMDRAQNYAQMVISGQKLTPQQRKDFQNLADVLYQESVKQYNSKRQEYSGFATDYGLNADRILGPAITSPKLPSAPIQPGAAPAGKARFLGFE